MISIVREFIEHKKEYFWYIVFLVVTMAVCTVILDAFWDITSELKGDRLPEIDEKVSAFIQSFRSEGLTSLVIPITRLGGKWGYLIMVPAAVIVLTAYR